MSRKREEFLITLQWKSLPDYQSNYFKSITSVGFRNESSTSLQYKVITRLLYLKVHWTSKKKAARRLYGCIYQTKEIIKRVT